MDSSDSTTFCLVFYVPPSHVEACKTAIFEAGAGRYPGPGNYTGCCWSTEGLGQFTPGDSANPHIGVAGQAEKTPEIRVEARCQGKELTRQVVAALKHAHPYEEAAYFVTKVEDF